MPPTRVVLVVGSCGSGKTSLIRRLSGGLCPSAPAPTVGIDMEAGHIQFTPAQEGLSRELEAELPPASLELQLWEIGGREPEREAPRGEAIHGLLVCYDCSNRSSFQRAAHALCRYRMDWHLAQSRAQGRAMQPQKELPTVLCGTKADAQDGEPAVKDDEVQRFVREHRVQAALRTSAKTGAGAVEALEALALAVLRAEIEHSRQCEEVAATTLPTAEAWSLPRTRAGVARDMTSPRGDRPHEPQRGSAVQELVEVLPADGHQQSAACAPRTVAVCLERGLLHRAVHLWLLVPRQGALLLRKYAADAVKHPGRWGPSCHRELRCYGTGGDGHAAELSAQAAERALGEQLGLELDQVEPLEHWFSCQSRVGSCHELLDVYVAAVSGGGLPELALGEGEDVDWVYYEDVLSHAAVEAGTICHLADEYRSAFLRQLRQHAVPEYVHAAFGGQPSFESARWKRT